MCVDDNQVAFEAAEGDMSAFAVLFERYYDKGFGLALKTTGNRALAEDIIQDVMAALPVKVQSFEGKSSFGSWFYRVVLNKVYDYRRQSGRYKKACEEWGSVQLVTDPGITDEQRWLHEVMGRLPEELSDTVVLMLEGWSHEEIGQMLSVSPGTVSWRISEAKKLLKAWREKEDG